MAIIYWNKINQIPLNLEEWKLTTEDGLSPLRATPEQPTTRWEARLIRPRGKKPRVEMRRVRKAVVEMVITISTGRGRIPYYLTISTSRCCKLSPSDLHDMNIAIRECRKLLRSIEKKTLQSEQEYVSIPIRIAS
jgi:hypothetical protein